MSRICVKSRRTNNLVFIPAHKIVQVGTDEKGHTFIDREDNTRLRVYQSLAEVEAMIQQAYGQRPAPVQQQVVQQTQVRVINQPYRPQSRSNSIIDTAVGVGAGIVGAELVGEAIDAIFGLDWF